MTRAEEWAKDFHETYERLAPLHGYKTREASAKPWREVPEQNRKLMIAVMEELVEPLLRERDELAEKYGKARWALILSRMRLSFISPLKRFFKMGA